MIDKLTINNDTSSEENSENLTDSNSGSGGTGKVSLDDWDVSHKDTKIDEGEEIKDDFSSTNKTIKDNKTSERKSQEIQSEQKIDDQEISNNKGSKEKEEPKKNSVSDNPSDVKKSTKQDDADNLSSEGDFTSKETNKSRKVEADTSKKSSHDNAKENASESDSSQNVANQEREFAWDDSSVTFIDEEQVYMNVQQKILVMKKSCQKMLEKNIATNEMEEAIGAFDEIIKTMNAPLPQEEDESDEEDELL